jgi:hypothetical protein
MPDIWQAKAYGLVTLEVTVKNVEQLRQGLSINGQGQLFCLLDLEQG